MAVVLWPFVATILPPFDGDDARTVSGDGTSLLLRSRKIRIEVVQGPDRGRIAELSGHGTRVGSGKDADIVLSDPTVSRHHLTIRIDAGTIRVVDNKSLNGTLLDGVRVVDAYARPDAVLTLGSTALRLRLLDEAIDVPLSPHDRFGNLLGRSVAMRRMFGLLERVAPTDMTVLIEGETGTGKELVAEGIHQHSARAGGPFVVFDCSAVSAALIESELLGHQKGAFTDARTDHPGRFEEADGGTLFLDEIGELPIELQPKLLRAIERREVRRLGDDRVRRVDVRLVAATNRSLSVEVDRGRFRDDLYHRLAEVAIHVPPLRSRLDDVPLLARHFEAALRTRQPDLPPLDPAAIARFRDMSWPGNVRELRNKVRFALLLGPERPSGPQITGTGASLPLADLAIRLGEPLLEGGERARATYERAYLQMALEQTGHNVTRTAELAGVGRRYVQRAMERYGLRVGRAHTSPPEGGERPAREVRSDRRTE
jgi:transcriptional regulator with GAF, ATPase, and Fis domain